CWAMVCRSARIWQGWNSSVSALTTGTVAAAAISSMRSWPKVRQTIAETIRVSTCVVSVIDSPRPSWLDPASITSGLPPSSATPVAKDTRVRVEDLSNMIATVRGPSRGRRAKRSPASWSARARTSFCSAGARSSSRRKWRGISVLAVEGGSVGDGGRVGDRVEQAGQSGGEGRELGVGDDQRRGQAQRGGVGRVDDETRRQGGRCDLLGQRGAQCDAQQQSGPAHPVDQRMLEGEDVTGEPLADGADVREQILLEEGAEHGQPRGRGQRVAAEGGAVLAGLEQIVHLRAVAEHGTDREAAAEALGEGHHVRLQALDRLVGEPAAGAAHTR